LAHFSTSNVSETTAAVARDIEGPTEGPTSRSRSSP
jgi:hypothetical protein